METTDEVISGKEEMKKKNSKAINSLASQRRTNPGETS
jgi:hypothetical protein